jgi:hypothetical protein
MAKHDVDHLASQIATLKERLVRFVEDSDLEELLKHLHQPGWTTPAEFRLVTSVVHVLNQNVAALTALKSELVASSREIVAAADMAAA